MMMKDSHEEDYSMVHCQMSELFSVKARKYEIVQK